MAVCSQQLKTSCLSCHNRIHWIVVFKNRIRICIMAEVEKNVDAPEGEGSNAAAASSGTAVRFEIKKWNAVTMWSWDICADVCAICRNSLNEPSIEYQANPSPNNENGLSVAFGNCGHVFHLDCIQRWLKTRSVCPLCNKEWDFSKIERIPGYGNAST